MKVLVKKYLNCRSGSPATDAPCPGYKSPGDILDVDNIVPGTDIDGNSIWYHCLEDSLYYWSGGIEHTSEILSSRPGGAVFTTEEQLHIYHSAVNELSLTYKNMPGIKGLAAGYKYTGGKKTGQLALIFFVEKKTGTSATPIPGIINYRGYPLTTDVNPAGKAKLQDLPQNIRPDLGEPYLMGGSVSEISDGKQPFFGTRTLLVSKSGKDYLLTCYHVACHSLFAQQQYTLNNASIEVSIPSLVISPKFSRKSFKVKEGEFGNTYDYALIDPGDTQVSNAMPDFDFSGYYTRSEVRQAFLQNRPLAKYGAASLDKRGSLIAFHSDSLPVNEDPPLSMSGLILATAMSEEGDSGAPVIDTTNNKLVGFIVGGMEGSPSLTYIIPIAELKFQFSIIPKI